MSFKSKEMKTVYRGHTIWLCRDRSLGGDINVYYTIVRDSDGFIVEDSFTSDTSPLRTLMKHMKGRVDAEIEGGRA
jgi:hypothetical protein